MANYVLIDSVNLFKDGIISYLFNSEEANFLISLTQKLFWSSFVALPSPRSEIV